MLVRRSVGVALAGLLGLVLAVSTAVTASATPAPTWLTYVNMGDSYSAGAGIVPVVPTAPPRCSQSTLNWGHVLASAKGYRLTDVSCSGAETKDFRNRQYPETPPQLDALSASTTLVTLTIGGNDSSVFTNAITQCGAAAARTAGQGSPCQAMYGDSFVRTIKSTTYPSVVRALKDVRARAPKARVAISGYLQILPKSKGCYPIVPIAVDDVPYLDTIEKTLNDAVRRAASQTGATFLDQSTTSAGHDACQPVGTRWVEPIVGSTNYIPVHPNALGEKAMADRAAAVLRL